MDRRSVATLALLVLLGLAGCGEPFQTEVVCAGCSAAPESVSGVTVEDSVTHMYVDDDGGARVEARMELTGDGVERLHTDRTLSLVRDRIAEAGEYERRGDRIRSAFQRRNLSTRMDGDTLVVTYRVTDISRQRLGTTVVDGFFRVDGDGRESEGNYDEAFELGTDRLVVHGPDGTRALVAPPEAERDDDSVTWTETAVNPRTYVVFGDNGALAHPAIALETLSWAGGPLVPWAAGATLPLFVLASVFAVYYPRRLTDSWHPADDPLFAAVACLAALVIAALVLLVLATPLSGVYAVVLLAVILAVLGAVFQVRGRFRQRLGGRSLIPSVSRTDISLRDAFDRATVTAIVAVLAVVATVTAVVAADYRAPLARPVLLVGLLVLLLAFPVLGHLVTSQARTWLSAVVVTTVAGTPWLVTFAATVESGADVAGGVVLALLIGGGGVVLCPLLFYAVVWYAMR
jgi:hypothetical protein